MGTVNQVNVKKSCFFIICTTRDTQESTTNPRTRDIPSGEWKIGQEMKTFNSNMLNLKVQI